MGRGSQITLGTKRFAKAQQTTLVGTDLVLKLCIPDIIKQKTTNQNGVKYLVCVSIII